VTGGDYTTVFDATTAGWTTWPPVLFGLGFVAVGLAFKFLPPRLFKRPPTRLFIYIFLGFSLFWTTIVAWATWTEYSAVMDAARDGKLKVVEGKVEKFVPMPWSGHAMERFCVKDACFAYSNFVVTVGFHNAASHGGPLHEGLPVRIAYMDNTGAPSPGNVIVKLEIGK
jgi:hypothetical protein